MTMPALSHLRTSAVLVIVMLTATVYWAGCGHRPPHDAPLPTVTVPGAKSVRLGPSSTGQMVLDKGVTYQIVNTPFGTAKQAVVKKAAGMAEPDPLPPSVFGQPAARPVTQSRAGKIVDVSPLKRTRQPAESAEPSTPGDVTFNFDDADLYEVIRSMAEVLDINYIVDPNVRGQVTIHTAGSLHRRDLFPLFFQILEANGLTAVKEGPLYHITKLKEAPRFPVTTRFGKDYSDLPPSERVVMQIIPLQFIDGAELIKIIKPFVSPDGTIIDHDQSNTVILVDKGLNVLKALQLAATFDADMFADVAHQFYKIDNSDVTEFAATLNQVMSAYTDNGNDLKIVPIQSINMLLAVSDKPHLFERLAHFIQVLDTPDNTVQPRIYFYAVKNGKADDLSNLLNSIFTSQSKTDKSAAGHAEKEKKDADKAPPPTNPFARKPAPQKDRQSADQSRSAVTEMGTGTLKGEIKITPDSLGNALIIEAIPSDYQIIQRILERLDVLPRQVLIEATIAEIKLDDNNEFGVEWRYKKGDGGSLSTTLFSAALGASGMNYVIGETERWSATLSALATEDKVNILSRPTVLASNDMAATINISTEIPLASSQYQHNDSGNAPVVTTNIEYRNTGIILNVTPHINENGLVSMDISQEVSEVAGNVIVAGQSYPSFFQRNVTTTLTAGHRQTIVIGGLIRENQSSGQTGVPGISQIPIIGSLFGKQSQDNSKSELVILITPRVIVNLNDVDVVTREFRNRVPNVDSNLSAR
ncbi:MAG: type II secretion system protein GspD [Deltaproteobacteria bacterium]|nr:MAG: type II secretion system protein GspD [Deltaproteobacteria bacterium]